MSSPNLNNVIIAGCILIYVAGVLFGLDKEQGSYLCQVNAYLPQKKSTRSVFGCRKLQFLNFISHDI